MRRTAERVMSMISIVFTGLAIIFSFMGLSALKMMLVDEARLLEFEEVMMSIDPSVTAEDLKVVISGLPVLEGIGSFLVILLVISLITTIIGTIFIWNNKRPKLAGILFIISGLFAYILSPTSILLYITAILCFARKPPLEVKGDPEFVESPDTSGMRPL